MDAHESRSSKMTAKPVMSGWRLFVRSVYWSPDPCLRVGNWLSLVNIALIFTPWKDVWFLAFIPMTIFALCGVSIIRLLRRQRRQKQAQPILEKEGGFWARETGRLLAQLDIAEKRFAPQAEKDELIARIEEASNRCRREITVYERKSR